MELKFWKKEEIKRLEKLVSISNSKEEAFRKFSIESGRSKGCISQKYYSISINGVRKSAKIKQLDFPQGFEFNFVPKRAVMQKNSVTLYF